MTVDHGHPEPLHRQLAAIIRSKIEDGTYTKGQKLPSILELAEENHIADRTVRQAIALLADDGLVTVLPSRGTVVQAPPQPH